MVSHRSHTLRAVEQDDMVLLGFYQPATLTVDVKEEEISVFDEIGVEIQSIFDGVAAGLA